MSGFLSQYKSKKSDYSISFYEGVRLKFSFGYVKNVKYALNWFETRFRGDNKWTHLAIYDRHSNRLLEIYSNNISDECFALAYKLNGLKPVYAIKRMYIGYEYDYIRYLDDKGIDFDYINVYSRSNVFLGRYYKE